MKNNMISDIYLNLDYNKFSEEGDCDHEDRWDRPDTYTTWEFAGASLVSVFRYGLSYPVTNMNLQKGERVFIVLAVWNSGDSFGYDSNKWCEIFGVFRDEAEADAFGKKLKNLKEGDTLSLAEDREIFIPWFGFFESLSYVEVLERVIE